MSGAAAKQAYSRAGATRLLQITERQLKSWEDQGLVQPFETYGFRELLALRTITKLRKSRRPVAQIRRALDALSETLRDVADPLTELKIYADGKRIRVELGSHAMEAESGQLLLNFDRRELKRLLTLKGPDPGAAERERRASAERWFQRGLELEQTGAPVEEVIDAYEQAIALDPHSAGALVNMGTLFFNVRQWKKAERYYLKALKVDPEYALAHFDLANLYDERGQRDQAMEHYLAALRSSPSYADAHYNLALLYQGANQHMHAVRHWTEYLKLDPSSQWATIARRELAKLRDAAVVPGSRA